MATDYGRDLWCRRELVTTREAKGIDVLSNAILRRLSTPRGRLFFHRDYGIDLSGLVGHEVTAGMLARVEADVVEQVEADRRVLEGTVRARVTETKGSTGSTITIEVSGDSDQGPFEVVTSVPLVTLELLGIREGA